MWKCIATCTICGEKKTLDKDMKKHDDICCGKNLRHDVYMYDLSEVFTAEEPMKGYIDGEIRYFNNKEKVKVELGVYKKCKQ